jgi:hypothetical protein
LAPDQAKAGSASPPLGDKLTFTTSLDLTATPKVVFSPVKSSFQMTDGSATGFLSRKGTHQVVVGLTQEIHVIRQRRAADVTDEAFGSPAA